MKYCLVILSALLTIFNTPFSLPLNNGKLLNDQVRVFLENFRNNMPGLKPPMAPLNIDQYDLNFDFEDTLTYGTFFLQITPVNIIYTFIIIFL